jgi:hypothetical protein
MTRVLRLLTWGLCLTCTLLFAACDDSTSPTAPSTPPPATSSPTPPTTPTPTPPPTFTVTGTIFETAPTANRRLESVQVTAANGPAGTSNGNGDFTVTGVLAGTQTLTVTKTDYETQTVSINVANADVSGVRVNLRPSPRIVQAEFHGELEEGDSPCEGTSRPCDVYQVGAHNAGVVEAFMIWESDLTEFDLELRCDGKVIEEAFKKGGVLEDMHADVSAGRQCELHVLQSGPKQEYTLHLKYPY